MYISSRLPWIVNRIAAFIIFIYNINFNNFNKNVSKVGIIMEKVCFIVPAYNAEKTIERCIKSIISQDINKEIFVIDNNSSDNTYKIIKNFENINIYVENRRGPAAARNRGLKEAYKSSCRYIAFVDSDVVLPKDWSKKAIEILEKNRDVAGVGGPARNMSRNFLSELFDPLFLYYVNTDLKDVESLATMNAMFKREVIKDMFFNENLIASEDPEFCFRLTKKGYRLLLSRNLTVLHDHPQKFGDIIKRWFNYGKYYILPYIIHKKVNKMLIFRIFYAILFFGILVFSLIYKNPQILIYLIFFIWLLYFYTGVKLLKRKMYLLPFSIVHTLKFHIHVLGILYSFLFLYPFYRKNCRKGNKNVRNSRI